MEKRWIVREEAPEAFVRSFDEHEKVVPQLLWNRGIRTVSEADLFFEPSFETDIHDPFLFTQMRSAVTRIFNALEAGESITVFGDYDADGITGSAVLITTLRAIENRPGASRISSYIPHRDKEGYGLQSAAVESLYELGANLIITVDCGIACVNEIARARELGMDVIVVDHHQFGETLPDAILIHPSIPGETYPFKLLAAVGVAWKLASALISEARSRGMELPEAFEKWLLDFVAIATITDIVLFIGDNRVLELFVLKVLNKSKRPGFSALIERAGLTWGSIGARDVGFAIGPRINAAGRMEHGSIALELLLAETLSEATDLSHRLEALNRARQQATIEMMSQADAMLQETANAMTPSVAPMIQVLWHPTWSPALVGLVAGKIADRFGMPAIAIGKHGDHWIGSGRSIPSYDITAAVKRVGDGLLTRSGGHPQACGFALADDRHVPLFAERLREDASANIRTEDLGQTLDVEMNLPLDHVSLQLTDMLKRFAPFGCGNPEPIFTASSIRILSSGTVGQTKKHLRFTAQDASGTARPFIAFNMGDRAADVRPQDLLDVAFTLGENEWNGRKEAQCKVVDFKHAT